MFDLLHQVRDLIGVSAAGRRHMVAYDGVQPGVPSQRDVVGRHLDAGIFQPFFDPFVMFDRDFVGVLTVDGLIKRPPGIHAPSRLAKLVGTKLSVRSQSRAVVRVLYPMNGFKRFPTIRRMRRDREAKGAGKTEDEFGPGFHVIDLGEGTICQRYFSCKAI